MNFVCQFKTMQSPTQPDYTGKKDPL